MGDHKRNHKRKRLNKQETAILPTQYRDPVFDVEYNTISNQIPGSLTHFVHSLIKGLSREGNSLTAEWRVDRRSGKTPKDLQIEV